MIEKCVDFISLIAAKQLVATIAAYRDSNSRPGGFADPISGQQRTVTKREPQRPDEIHKVIGGMRIAIKYLMATPNGTGCVRCKV